MSLVGSLNAIRAGIIANIPDFTANNCSIGDEAVFNYIQTTASAPRKCAIIELSGFNNRSQSEFRSSTIMWRFVVNGFFAITDSDYTTPLANARAFIDQFLQMCSTNPTLGGTVMVLRMVNGGDPLEYRRSSFAYVLVTFEVEVMDNIS